MSQKTTLFPWIYRLIEHDGALRLQMQNADTGKYETMATAPSFVQLDQIAQATFCLKLTGFREDFRIAGEIQKARDDYGRMTVRDLIEIAARYYRVADFTGRQDKLTLVNMICEAEFGRPRMKQWAATFKDGKRAAQI